MYVLIEINPNAEFNEDPWVGFVKKNSTLKDSKNRICIAEINMFGKILKVFPDA